MWNPRADQAITDPNTTDADRCRICLRLIRRASPSPIRSTAAMLYRLALMCLRQLVQRDHSFDAND